jgi:hypothetical protein
MENKNESKLEKMLSGDSIIMFGTAEAVGFSAFLTSYLLGNALYESIALGFVLGTTVLAESGYNVLSRPYNYLRNKLKQRL